MGNGRICASAGEQLGETADSHWGRELMVEYYMGCKMMRLV
jgi:hypothetical protein